MIVYIPIVFQNPPAIPSQEGGVSLEPLKAEPQVFGGPLTRILTWYDWKTRVCKYYSLRIQVCPKEGIGPPSFLFFLDGIGTQNILL